MKMVWVNPAFKDQISVVTPEEKKEDKPVAKQQVEAKPENNKDKKEQKNNITIIITETVIQKVKDKGINTDKLTDLLNKEFTKKGLIDELSKRNIPKEEIDKIVCRAKEKKPELPSPPKAPLRQRIEYKLFKYLMDKEIPIETSLINGETFTGKIKWFSDWLIGLRVDGTIKTVLIPRLMIVSYTPLVENSLSENEINQLPPADVIGIEVNRLQQFKNNKTPLLFHMQGGMKIKGTLNWYEKVVYHIKSLDGKADHTLHRGNIVYFEEAV